MENKIVLITTFSGQYICEKETYDIAIGEGKRSSGGIGFLFNSKDLYNFQAVTVGGGKAALKIEKLSDHPFKIENILIPEYSISSINFINDESSLVYQEFVQRKSGLVTSVSKKDQKIILEG